MSEKREIIQIMPAGGWYAVFTDGDKGELKSPLVAWALVRTTDGDDVCNSVEGIDSADGLTDPVTGSRNFDRYEHFVAGYLNSLEASEVRGPRVTRELEDDLARQERR